jgi:hypothetical protein
VLKANGVGKKHVPTTVKSAQKESNNDGGSPERINKWRNRRDYSSPIDEERDQYRESVERIMDKDGEAVIDLPGDDNVELTGESYAILLLFLGKRRAGSINETSRDPIIVEGPDRLEFILMMDAKEGKSRRRAGSINEMSRCLIIVEGRGRPEGIRMMIVKGGKSRRKTRSQNEMSRCLIIVEGRGHRGN